MVQAVLYGDSEQVRDRTESSESQREKDTPFRLIKEIACPLC